jgi:hypothetical protein
LGVTNINSLLNSSRLQTQVQQGLMNVNFDQLKQLGTITGLESSAQLGPLLNVATKFGSETATAWLSSATGASGIASAITSGIGSNISGLLSGGASGAVSSLLSSGAGAQLSGLLSGGSASALAGSLLSSSGLTASMTSFASSAQFASVFSSANSFLAGGGNPLQAGIVVAKGFNNTTNRTNLDQAITALIGNPKITVPDFAPQGTG